MSYFLPGHSLNLSPSFDFFFKGIYAMAMIHVNKVVTRDEKKLPNAPKGSKWLQRAYNGL